MAYKQIRSFSLARMGTKKGWCLQNCRVAFGISKGTYMSAKADMLAQKSKGTLHDIATIPTNCAVAVYLDTASKYEHVMIYDHGTYYSDGRRLTSTNGLKFFGWGEYCDGERVVEYTADAVISDGFLPSKGYWAKGDSDARVGQLAQFMRTTFPAYTSAKALGNYYGDYIAAAIKEFQKRTGLEADGKTGPLTYARLQQYGFKG